MTRQKIVEKINEISSKYRFRDTFEIESQEVLDFCRSIMQAQYIGLNLDNEDLEFIQAVLYNC